MRLLGILLQAAYLSSRHTLFGLRIDVALTAASLVGALLTVQQGQPMWSAALLAVGIAGMLLLAAGRRTGYVLFRPSGRPAPADEPAQLPTDSQVPVHASGPFAVRNQVRCLANHPAFYTTPRSREHILMARQKTGRLLLLGKSQPNDWGWWYQFFRPEAIERVELGRAIHGWRPRPALRVSYWVEDDDGRRQQVATILGFDRADRLAQVWGDLTLDWPASRPTP